MKASLGAILAIGLAGLQLIAVLAVVLFSYITSENALLTHAKGLLKDVGRNATEHSKEFLRPARSAADLAARLSEHHILKSEDPDILERFLFQQLLVAPQFSGLYFATTDGGFVFVMRSNEQAPFLTKIIRTDDDRPGSELFWRDKNFNVIKHEYLPDDPFDPRARLWFIRAREEMKMVWTDPYIFFTSQQPGITLSSPVRDAASAADDIRGVIGVDIEISSISNFLAMLQIGANGKALIINRNGDVIAHPDRSLLKSESVDGSFGFVNIAEFKDPIAREAFSSLGEGFDGSAQEEIQSKFVYNDMTYISALIPVASENLPWKIGVYAPVLDFIGPLKRSRLLGIWIAVLVAGLTGLAGLALANYIHRPVRAFAVRSSLIAQGEIDPSSPSPATYKELTLLNDTLVQQIVARKKTEREYGQSFDLSNRGMAQIAPASGKLLKANGKLSEITGYSVNELCQKKFADLLAEANPNRKNVIFFASADNFSAQRETQFIRKDQSLIDVEVNAILIHDHHGAPLHTVITVDDISEAKRQENQIARLNRDLFHLARGHTLGQMAAGLAHELNQPLAAIAQNADTALFLISRSDNLPDELREVLGEIEEQSIRAGDIIRALRDFVMKDADNKVTLDIVELVSQAIRLVSAEAREAGVVIETCVDEPCPPVTANRIQIAQVIVNLLRNAIEAIANSKTRAGLIKVRIWQMGNRIRIAIEDNGPGINPNITIFTQFETSKPHGMGLGLTICRSMVEANDGDLWHDETFQSGARFCFTLPVGSS